MYRWVKILSQPLYYAIGGVALKIIAIDIGATNLRVALFNNTKKVDEVKERTPKDSPESLSAKIIECIESLCKKGDFDRIGIGSIGPLNLEEGTIEMAPNLGLRNVPLRNPLVNKFKKRVYIANDAMAGVWAEKVLGKGKESNDIVYLTISTGIGVGVIVDGNLLVGRRGNAHEMGHAVLDYTSNDICGCGGIGHWETFAGGRNIKKVALEKATVWNEERTNAYDLAVKGKLEPEKLYQLAREGDKFATYLVDQINRVHAAGIASIVAAYDPEKIFIGGSIYLYNEDLIRASLIKYARLYSGFGVPVIEKASFGDDQVLYGAASIAINPPKQIERFASKL
ncbi:MAG: ROK family protein [Caldisphaeraceae archaeon]|nr:ROK family protein [Caldisphaeraceae archaeon]MEB3692604.1 ROK family protein [Caldisphaeraceae archaeon]MEB3798552.1 ROK family protein [Caldisphaeraceae archaeon]